MNRTTTQQHAPRSKDMLIGFMSLSFLSATILFVLVWSEVLTLQQLLSFRQPAQLLGYTLAGSASLLLLGILFAFLIPDRQIDEGNKAYTKMTVPYIIGFMMLAGIFEEMLFRGIIQNMLLKFTGSEWAAIILASALFIVFHVQYFKKPLMLATITIPGLLFGWIYFAADNLLVPIIVHTVMNIGVTLLYKYNLLKSPR